jgi:hypothetical protein
VGLVDRVELKGVHGWFRRVSCVAIPHTQGNLATINLDPWGNCQLI